MTDSTGAAGGRPICDYENSTYRTDFWEGQGREYEDLAERKALRRLLPPMGGRLLDIGAGFGRLADLYDGYRQVVLLDYSFSQLQFARRRLGDERFIYVAADIYRLPLATDSIDTTVMVRVLHHLVDVPGTFAQIARATRPGGAFVLEFANKRHLKNLARRLLGRGYDPFAREPVEFAPLHYDFHPAWVAERLGEAGFRPERALAVSLLRMAALKRALPARLLAAIDGVLQRPLAGLAPAPSQFLRSRATKAGDAASRDGAMAFRCPACGDEPLEAAAGAWRCRACGASYPVIDGIHVFKDAPEAPEAG